jgi:hypothetical protein
MLYESMPRSFFIHAGGTPALPVTPSHRLFNPALLVALFTPGYWLSPLRGLGKQMDVPYDCQSQIV